jgi:hypothetical protein
LLQNKRKHDDVTPAVEPAVSPVQTQSNVTNTSLQDKYVGPADWLKLFDYFNAEVIYNRLEKLQLSPSLQAYMK